MSAEATLQAHWRGLTEAHSYEGLNAFADHLAELWPQAVREDAEHQRDTGASLPDVLRLNGVPTLRVRYCHDYRLVDVAGEPLFEFLVSHAQKVRPGRRGVHKHFFTFGGPTTHPPFDRWEYERVTAFVAWLWEGVKPAEVDPPKTA